MPRLRYLRPALILVMLGCGLTAGQPAAAAPIVIEKLPPPAPSPAIAGVDAPPGCSFAYASAADPTPHAIADNSTITQTLSFSGLAQTLWQIDVHTAISHTYAGDLDIFRASPHHGRTTLTTDNGAGADNVFANTQWGDRSYFPPVTDVILANNVNQPYLTPEGALGQFRFRDPNGDWQLVVTDDFITDTGTLNSWSLDLIMLRELLDTASAFPTNSTDLPIPNAGTITSTITVTMPEHYLTNVTVLVYVPHTDSDDLTLVLMAPNGVTTTLASQNGGSFDNIYNGTTFTDDPIGGPITDASYVDGEHVLQAQPEGALDGFVGFDPNGTWKLIITDDTANGASGVGTLTDWQLGLYTGHCQPIYLPQTLGN